MIMNEREYRITKAQLERFRRALRKHASEPRDDSVRPALHKAEAKAMASQIDKLRRRVTEYETLVAGKIKVIMLDSFDELPIAFIEARIAAGLTQKGLAERLGLKEQQIQRYEATRYAAASFSRMRELAKALGVRVHEEVLLPSAKRRGIRKAARP